MAKRTAAYARYTPDADMPKLRRDFKVNSDPDGHAQYREKRKSETQRREESTQRVAGRKQARAQSKSDDKAGRGSNMVGKDKPKHNLKPPQQTRGQVDRETFSNDWVIEARDAAFAQAAPIQSHQQPEHEMSHAQHLVRTRPGPSR